MDTLRFAPIVRVSTEQQEKQGESLKTQMLQINQYVQALGGTIPSVCWQYSGQEHATPDQERKRLDKLLADSTKKVFDAVIVCDASRWSRDNLKSKEGLNILRANNIRFFVGTTEYDLYNPAQNLFLGMSAEIGEYQAREQALKSIVNRINRAKNGIPTAGKLPYGRTWDEKNGWRIDEEKQRIIQQAAKRYLDGETILSIAATYNMNFSNLWKLLSKRSGTEWPISFRNDKVNVHETVIMKVPPLLKETTIEAIKERARSNKTYTHGEIKHKYLLSRMIFCTECGYALSGFTNHSGTRYYRHSFIMKHYKNKCSSHRFIPANEIENAILLQLITTFGDKERIDRAIKQGTPDFNKLESLNDEKNKLTIEQKKIFGQKNSIIDSIADQIISKDEAKLKMEKLRAREKAISERLHFIDAELSNIPDPKKIKHLTSLTIKVLEDAIKNNPKAIFKKSYEWKRNIVEHAFAGLNSKGDRFGVYMTQTNNMEQPWMFEIRGAFETTLMALPLSDEYLIEMFKLDPMFQDIGKELERIKTSFASH